MIYPLNWHFKSTSTNTTNDFLFEVAQVGPDQVLGLGATSGGEDDGADFFMVATSSFDSGVANWTSPVGYSPPKVFSYAGFTGTENIIDSDNNNFERIVAYKILPNGKVLLIYWWRGDQGDPGNTFSYEQYLLPMLSSLQVF